MDGRPRTTPAQRELLGRRRQGERKGKGDANNLSHGGGLVWNAGGLCKIEDFRKIEDSLQH